MNGIVCSLFLSKKRIAKDKIVNPNVRILNFMNVCLMMSKGFVKALELAEAKNAGIFSIDKGKNYIIDSLL